MQRYPEISNSPNPVLRKPIDTSPNSKLPILCKLSSVKSHSSLPNGKNPIYISRSIDHPIKPPSKPMSKSSKPNQARGSMAKLPPLENILSRSIKRMQQFSLPSSKSIEEMHEIKCKVPEALFYSQPLIHLEKRSGYEDKKTLILDLDETLIHAKEDAKDCHISLDIGKGKIIGVNIRPFVYDLLKFASSEFEVIVFTASSKNYADCIIDHIDPTRNLVHHRIYRDSCFEYQGNFIKNIGRIANRDLKDVVIVDNCLVSFCMQVDNGIPISNWYEDLNDIQLKILMDYLKVLIVTNDVRVVNQRFFALKYNRKTS